MLKYIAKYGDDGPDGKNTLLSVKALQELKFDLFTSDQKKDKQVSMCFVVTEHELTGLL